MSDAPLPDELDDSPPSTKLVYRELETASDPLSYRELAERTGLGRSTVRRATNRLEEADLAERVWVSTQRVAYRLQGGGACSI